MPDIRVIARHDAHQGRIDSRIGNWPNGQVKNAHSRQDRRAGGDRDVGRRRTESGRSGDAHAIPIEPVAVAAFADRDRRDHAVDRRDLRQDAAGVDVDVGFAQIRDVVDAIEPIPAMDGAAARGEGNRRIAPARRPGRAGPLPIERLLPRPNSLDRIFFVAVADHARRNFERSKLRAHVIYFMMKLMPT